MDPIKTERESLQDLKAILAETKAYDIKFLVMGGWAVTAYVGRHRYTKDIDLVTSKALEGPIRGILKRLGYDVSNRTFGLAAEKQKESIDLKVHISIGRILDESRTGKALAYPIPEEAYEQAPLLRITSYHPECRPYEFQVPILPLEDLFIAKVLPLGRENDVLDVASLIINRGGGIDLLLIASKVQRSKLTTDFRERVESLAAQYATPDFNQSWASATGRRLAKVQVGSLLSLLRNLSRQLS